MQAVTRRSVPPDAVHAVVARDLTKVVPLGRGREQPILRGVSLDIPWSSSTAVVGRSGSGKSTLLHCLAGLERPSAGTVVLDGVDLGTSSRAQVARLRRRSVGVVFQAYNLVPTMTVAQNVVLPLRLRGERASRRRVRDVLGSLGLADRAGARPATLSGGEQQRVALARVLLADPRVVLADEPTGALDGESASLVMSVLRTIASTAGRAVVVVTHDHAVAAACDRVVGLEDGVITSDGWATGATAP